MATFITVTTGVNNIIVRFNDLASHEEVKRKANWFPRSSVAYCTFLEDSSAILIYVNGGGEWRIDMNGVDGLPVSSVNGIVPTDNDHLFTLLSEM